MIWPFTKKSRPDPPGVVLAHAAQRRAEATIETVEARTGEVNTYYSNLRERRLQNNFGAALQAAMGPRT